MKERVKEYQCICGRKYPDAHSLDIHIQAWGKTGHYLGTPWAVFVRKFYRYRKGLELHTIHFRWIGIEFNKYGFSVIVRKNPEELWTRWLDSDWRGHWNIN